LTAAAAECAAAPGAARGPLHAALRPEELEAAASNIAQMMARHGSATSCSGEAGSTAGVDARMAADEAGDADTAAQPQYSMPASRRQEASAPADGPALSPSEQTMAQGPAASLRVPPRDGPTGSQSLTGPSHERQ
jgi:hypothetical protein